MPGRVDLGATAERTISTLSESLGAAGDAARDAGSAVRDRLRDSARAVERGGRALRNNGVRSAATAAAQRARRHRKTLLGVVGAVAGGLLALGALRRARARSGIRWPWRR
jgi:hypothetical protein